MAGGIDWARSAASQHAGSTDYATPGTDQSRDETKKAKERTWSEWATDMWEKNGERILLVAGVACGIFIGTTLLVGYSSLALRLIFYRPALETVFQAVSTTLFTVISVIIGYVAAFIMSSMSSQSTSSQRRGY